jgi:hypothetical protein
VGILRACARVIGFGFVGSGSSLPDLVGLMRPGGSNVSRRGSRPGRDLWGGCARPGGGIGRVRFVEKGGIVRSKSLRATGAWLDPVTG